MIINKRRNKEEEKINTQVKNGTISVVKQYKYLGEWYNEKGNKDVSLEKRKLRVNYFLREIKKYGDVRRVGRMALEIRQKIYETVVVPTLFANIETWSHISDMEIKELENLQYRILKGMFGMPLCTPYWGIIAESGIWPVTSRIHYRKIMLFHNIVQSEDKRLIKEIVQDQLKAPYGQCWTMGIKSICEKYGIDIEKLKAREKKVVKKEIKEKIIKDIEKSVNDKKQEMKKLRWVKGFGKETYMKDLSTEDAMLIMKTRLNMIEVKSNFRGKYKTEVCELCEQEEDTTEHLFTCEKLEKIRGDDLTIESLKYPSKRLAEFIKLAMIKKKIVHLGIAGSHDQGQKTL